MPDPAPARPLPLLWGAVGAGGVLAAVGLTAAAPTPPAMAEHADAAFYAVALLSAVGTVAALAVVRRMEGRLPLAPDAAARQAAVQTHGVAALALAEVPALASGVAVFLTGNVLALAFLVPFLAVVALTWPTRARVERWLAGR